MNQSAYKIIPAFQNLSVVPEESEITCLTCGDGRIYVGTDDGMLYRFTYEELTDETGQTFYFYDRTKALFLGQKKNVSSIRVMSIIFNYVVVLFDEVLLFFTEDHFEVVPSLKLKNVTCFDLREGATRDETFTSQICAGLKKKAVQLLTVGEDRLQLIREVAVPGLPLALSFDGSLVCAGLSDRYYITELDRNEGQDVFETDSSLVKPLVLHVARGEFLLNGPNGLGISTSYNAESKRPPILLNNGLVDMILRNPFILALNDEFITIHSTLKGCAQMQSIPFKNGRCLAYTGAEVFAATARNIFALLPVPWQQQADELLDRDQVDAALEVCEHARRSEKDPARYHELHRLVLQKAGFVELRKMRFKEARLLFDKGQLELPELIRLFPGLPPSDISPRPDALSLEADAEKRRRFQAFLAEYLVEQRESEVGRRHRRLVDIALVKLYGEIHRPDELEGLLTLCNISRPDVFDISNYLISNKRHHAAALLLKQHKLFSDAMDIWKCLADGGVEDAAFPGFDFVVAFMKELPDNEVLSRHAAWIIDRDAEKAVEVVIAHDGAPIQGLSPDALLDRIAPHPGASLRLLEFLVCEKGHASERLHTQLASLYIELCTGKEAPETDLTQRCRRFLRRSEQYRVQFVLGKLQDTKLRVETATVLGKLGEHDRALRILGRELGDYEEAKCYCLNYGSCLKSRRQLFETLLSIYLDSSGPESDMMVGPALDLLNSPDAVFNSAEVLRQLPDTWAVSVVAKFLNCSLRAALHQRRAVSMRRGLVAGEAERHAQQAAASRRRRFDLDFNSRCPACGEAFVDVDCALTPDLGLVHTHCSQR